MSTFSKYRVGGPAAREYLDALLACKLPPPGRMCLAPMLGRDGKLCVERSGLSHGLL